MYHSHHGADQKIVASAQNTRIKTGFVVQGFGFFCWFFFVFYKPSEETFQFQLKPESPESTKIRVQSIKFLISY